MNNCHAPKPDSQFLSTKFQAVKPNLNEIARMAMISRSMKRHQMLYPLASSLSQHGHAIGLKVLIPGSAKKAGDIPDKFIAYGHRQPARVKAEADFNDLMIGVSLVVRALTD
jgi:hypothetical protein